MPTMTSLVDGQIPVAATFNANYSALNQAVGTGTTITTYTTGDTVYASASNTLSKLAVGKAGQGLTLSSGIPAWGNYSGGQIWGLKMSNGTDATNDIDIAVGIAVSDDSAHTSRVAMALTSAYTKQLDAAWAVGSAAGGLDIGTIANGTYHMWLIMRSDTGVVDALFSRNPNTTATITVTIASPGVVTWTAHGLQAGSSVLFTTTGALPTGITASTRYYVISTGLTADAFQFSASEGGAAVNTSGSQSGVHTGAASPVMPTNYDKKHLIGSVLRESAALVTFVQDGDYFYRGATVLDINTTNPGTSAVTRTLSVPVGVNVRAIMRVGATITTAANQTFALISDLSVTDEAAALSNSQVFGAAALSSAGGTKEIDVRTNAAAQVRSRLSTSDANTVLTIRAVGWIHPRGKNS